MDYTLSSAAKATGKGKSTLHRAIKTGKLSAKRTEEGSWIIDAAELARAFPVEPAQPSPWDNAGRNDSPLNEGGTEIAVLRVRAEMLEMQLQREQETVNDLRRRLDRSEERVLALLADPARSAQRVSDPPAADVAPPELPASATALPPAKTHRSLLGRLFGRF